MVDRTKYVLLVHGLEVGSVAVRGVFESHSEAEEFAEEELGEQVTYDIQEGMYY